MESLKIETHVLEIIEEGIKEKVTDLDMPLIGADCFMDSLLVVTMICKIEKEFQISFEDDLEMEYLDSVRTLIKGVESRVN